MTHNAENDATVWLNGTCYTFAVPNDGHTHDVTVRDGVGYVDGQPVPTRVIPPAVGDPS